MLIYYMWNILYYYMCVLYNLPHFCTACVTVRFVNDINCSVFLSWVAITCLSAIERLANASSHWERIQKRIQKRKPGFNDRKLKHQKQCETSETCKNMKFCGIFWSVSTLLNPMFNKNDGKPYTGSHRVCSWVYSPRKQIKCRLVWSL